MAIVDGKMTGISTSDGPVFSQYEVSANVNGIEISRVYTSTNYEDVMAAFEQEFGHHSKTTFRFIDQYPILPQNQKFQKGFHEGFHYTRDGEGC